MERHALVHDDLNQLAKIQKRKEKKKLRKLGSNEQAKTIRQTEERSTETDVFAEHDTTSRHTVEGRSTQTELFAEHDKSNTEQLTILREVYAKVNLLKQVLQIHYGLLAEASKEQE